MGSTRDIGIDVIDGTGAIGEIGDDAVDSAAIEDGAIVNADVNSAAAIAHTKLAAVADGKVIVGNGSNVPVAVAISGDVTLANTGAVTIAAGAVDNAMLSSPKIGVAQETVLATALVDGTGATGTHTFTATIPAGAIVTQSTISALTGFAGDTSATVQIGDGSTADRYNTSTPNVFTTAAHISAGAVSGTAYDLAAITPVVTVTSDSDITSVITDANGSMVITIFYYTV